MVLVKLFGGISIEGGSVALSGKAAHRHRLALLALLSVPPRRAWSRDKLIALLWPEKDAIRARNLLNQGVHALRGHFGEDLILSTGDELALNPERISSDVRRFEDAIATGDLRSAIAQYGGSFLDGFFLPNAAEFDHWADSTREHLRRSFHAALEKLAEQAGAAGELDEAAVLWQRRTSEEPGNARATLRLMAALEAVGDHAGALRVARAHTAHLRSEFQAEPSPEVLALAERIRTNPVAAKGTHHVAARTPQPREVHPAESAENVPRAAVHAAQGGGLHVPLCGPTRPRARVRVTTVGMTAAVAVVAAVLIGSARVRRSAGPSPEVPPFARQVVDPAADRAYQRGLSDIDRAESARFLPPSERAERHRSAAREFENAIAIAPHWAAAHARLAGSYQWLAGGTRDAASADSLYAKARAAAERAIEIDAEQASAHATLGMVLYRYDWDWEGADRAFGRAVALDPQAHNREYAQYLVAAGRYDEAIHRLRLAKERNPGSDVLQWQIALAHECAGRGEAAREAAAELERRMGGREPARGEGLRVGAGAIPLIAFSLAREGRYAEAIEMMEEHVVATENEWPAVFGLVYVKALAGHRDEARTMWLALEGRPDRPERSTPANLVAALGDTTRALDMVEQAFQQRPWQFAHFRCSETYRLLGDEPRIQAIIRKIGFPR